jgi:hypothetical protein
MNIGLVNVVSHKDEDNIEKDLSEKQKMILDNLYRCRDLEINNLWQKGVFLGPFLVLCFTGYGFLLHELLGEKTFSLKMNFLCIALCVVSATFSILWIYMFKGSKAQYELCERAISNYEQRELKIPYGYAMGTLRPDEIEFNKDLFSTKAGKFSPSKINIVIGQVSLWIWIYCFLFHLGICFYGVDTKIILIISLIIGFLFFLIAVKHSILSGISYTLFNDNIISSYLNLNNEDIYKREIHRIIDKKKTEKKRINREYINKVIAKNQEFLSNLQEIYGTKERATKLEIYTLFTEEEIIYLDACRYLVELGEVNISEENIVKNKSEESIMEKNLSTLALSLGIEKEQVEKLNNYIREKYQK